MRQGQHQPVSAPDHVGKSTQDAAVQVGLPSLRPSNGSCKFQDELQKKNMDLLGLSPLAVIMIDYSVFFFFVEPAHIPSGNLEHLRTCQKNPVIPRFSA